MNVHLAKLRKPLTREGHAKLVDEHKKLLLVDRPKVVDGITIAAAEGDRSENAEYIYGKKRLREIDRRLRYLTTLIKDAQLIDPKQIRSESVCFGASVQVEDEDGIEKTWTIVGEGETGFWANSVSWKSPVAKALFGKKVGDEVEVDRPAGVMSLIIRGIRYGSES